MSYSTRGTYRRLGLLYRYLLVATKRLSQKQLMILLAVVVGLAAGFATYLFEGLLVLVRTGLTSWLAIDTASPLYLVYPIIGVILATLFVRYWVRDDISEGVTRVLYAMSKKGSRIKPHNCYTSVVASATTIGFGGSVGPEAPIVLTGAAVGSNIARFMRLNYKNITLLLSCGAAAALMVILIRDWRLAFVMYALLAVAVNGVMMSNNIACVAYSGNVRTPIYAAASGLLCAPLYVVSSFAGAAIVGRFSYTAVFLIAMAVYAVCALLTFTLKDEPNRR